MTKKYKPKMKYYVYNIEEEREESIDFDTLEQAIRELCRIAGIPRDKLELYMTSDLCEYEIRYYDINEDEGGD